MTSLLALVSPARRSLSRSGGTATLPPEHSQTAREQTLRHWQRLKDIEREEVYQVVPFKLVLPLPALFAIRNDYTGKVRADSYPGSPLYEYSLMVFWDRLDNLAVIWRKK